MRRLAVLVLAVAVSGCTREAKPAPPVPPDTQVRGLADLYLRAYFERYPEKATYYGVPGRRHGQLTDNARLALEAWQNREEIWLRQLKEVDPATLRQPEIRAAYAILREQLESSIAARICDFELWDISQVFGWLIDDAYLVTIQPVGTNEAREDALSRWRALPRYVDLQIENLHGGQKIGYSAPKNIVKIVIDQVDHLLATPIAESPFDSPSVRDKTPAFQRDFDDVVKYLINPALRRYRDFLQYEYLPAAREAIGVSSNPDGQECYAAAVRLHSSLAVAPKDVHALGLEQVAAIDAEMTAIAERSFGTSDVRGLLERLRTDKRYLFRSREDLIGYSQNALARAKGSMADWFGTLPKADVVIEPYPKFREQNGPNEYNAPAEDGSRPGIFYINAYQAEKKTRVPAEDTAFHETIPGHHLQVSIALERKAIHPIGRYLGTSGYAEGWGLYAERLADEMKLYSSDLDRLGMLSGLALRATRLVVDSGMHTMGWTRQQAIDYMLAHTAEARDDVVSEVDRYISAPGQATAYMLGMLEIRKARDEAQRAMGPRFDIKAFHDRVLEDGAVPVSFLREKIRAWSVSPS